MQRLINTWMVLSGFCSIFTTATVWAQPPAKLALDPLVVETYVRVLQADAKVSYVARLMAAPSSEDLNQIDARGLALHDLLEKLEISLGQRLAAGAIPLKDFYQQMARYAAQTPYDDPRSIHYLVLRMLLRGLLWHLFDEWGHVTQQVQASGAAVDAAAAQHVKQFKRQGTHIELLVRDIGLMIHHIDGYLIDTEDYNRGAETELRDHLETLFPNLNVLIVSRHNYLKNFEALSHARGALVMLNHFFEYNPLEELPLAIAAPQVTVHLSGGHAVVTGNSSVYDLPPSISGILTPFPPPLDQAITRTLPASMQPYWSLCIVP